MSFFERYTDDSELPLRNRQQGQTYYDRNTGNTFVMIEQEKTSHAHSWEQQQQPANAYGPGDQIDYYQWWGSSWRLGNCWMWFWGFLFLGLLILGAVGFGFAIYNMHRIDTVDSAVASVMSTVSSQGQTLATLTTPFLHTGNGALVTTNVRQNLDCGPGTPCVMTLPADMSPYVSLPEICVFSIEAAAHTIAVTGPAFFQPGGYALATFLGGSAGEHICFQVISSTVAAVTSVSGVILS